jgi:hypothetical protein
LLRPKADSIRAYKTARLSGTTFNGSASPIIALAFMIASCLLHPSLWRMKSIASMFLPCCAQLVEKQWTVVA